MSTTNTSGIPNGAAVLLTVAWLSSFAAGAAAQDGDSIVTVELGHGLAMLVGRGGNVGASLGEDGALLVDDKFAPLAPRLQQAVAKLGGGDVRFVLNTHWHGDHTGGNEAFGSAGAIVFGHANVRQRMSEDQWNPFFERTTPASPAAALPIVTFDRGLTLHLNGETVEVLAVGPAHTDGDALVVFRGANVIHMGDVYFNGLYPFVDLASGGSIDGVIRALEVGLSHADAETKIIPGHGPLADRTSLVAYRDMLAAVRDAVKVEVAAGKSVDEVIASRPSRPYDEKWGGGFVSPDDFVRMVHASLSGGS